VTLDIFQIKTSLRGVIVVLNECTLDVMMTTRDRTTLTLKAIESLYINSSLFKEINIYLYDNNSNLSEDRIKLFKKLLTEKKICHYSYTTDISNGYCFAKLVAHKQWTDLVLLKHEAEKTKYFSSIKRYFLIMDNDMIVNKNWDQTYVSVCDFILVQHPTIHFLAPWPSGITPKRQEHTPIESCKSYFNQNEITYGISSAAGGSGFWFMNLDMLSKMDIQHKDIIKSLRKFKQHDSILWNKFRGDTNTPYMIAIKYKKDNPHVIHLGKITGSICNSLTSHTYDTKRQAIFNVDKTFNKSIEELFQLYKEECSTW
jgi:hypothetical protein